MKIKYVNKPKKPDGKFGNIKGDDGETYFVNVGCLGKYQVGMEITPPFENKKWGQDVVKVIPPHFDPSANSNAPEPDRPAGNSARLSPSPDKDVLITATALMKSYIETGKFGLTDLDTLMKACVPAARLMVKAASGVPSSDH